MHSKIRAHIRCNVVGYVALFFALSAGAYAAALEEDSVRSKHIKDGQVKNRDIRSDAVTTDKVSPSTLTTDDIQNDSLSGIDIAESSLGQVPSAKLGGFGRTGADTICDPETETFITCAATEVLTVPAGARALVLARVTASNESDANSFTGECRLGTSSVGVIANTTHTFLELNDDVRDSATLVGISAPLPAGATSFGMDCNQIDDFGAVQYGDASATVLLIADD